MYDNAHNARIQKQVRELFMKHINDQVAKNEAPHHNKIMGQLESQALRHHDVPGGGAHLASSLGDMGFEHTLAPSGEPVPKTRKPRKKKEIIGGSSEILPGGPVVLGTKSTEIGGALETLKDLDSMHGQPPDENIPTVEGRKVTVKSRKEDYEGSGLTAGGITGGGTTGGGMTGGARSARNEIVKRIMKEQGLSLPQASKYVKDHNLYKKKYFSNTHLLN